MSLRSSIDICVPVGLLFHGPAVMIFLKSSSAADGKNRLLMISRCLAVAMLEFAAAAAGAWCIPALRPCAKRYARWWHAW
jgi:hypothetical protein